LIKIKLQKPTVLQKTQLHVNKGNKLRVSKNNSKIKWLVSKGNNNKEQHVRLQGQPLKEWQTTRLQGQLVSQSIKKNNNSIINLTTKPAFYSKAGFLFAFLFLMPGA
jgi:hypothetical protein